MGLEPLLSCLAGEEVHPHVIELLPFENLDSVHGAQWNVKQRIFNVWRPTSVGDDGDVVRFQTQKELLQHRMPMSAHAIRASCLDRADGYSRNVVLRQQCPAHGLRALDGLAIPLSLAEFLDVWRGIIRLIRRPAQLCLIFGSQLFPDTNEM